MNKKMNNDKLSTSIIEHLKTKKKYNTLDVKYRAKCEEADIKGMQLIVEKRIKDKQIKLFDEKLEELTKEIIKLKEERIKLKKDIKDLKKRSDK